MPPVTKNFTRRVRKKVRFFNSVRQYIMGNDAVERGSIRYKLTVGVKMNADVEKKNVCEG